MARNKLSELSPESIEKKYFNKNIFADCADAQTTFHHLKKKYSPDLSLNQLADQAHISISILKKFNSYNQDFLPSDAIVKLCVFWKTSLNECMNFLHQNSYYLRNNSKYSHDIKLLKIISSVFSSDKKCISRLTTDELLFYVDDFLCGEKSL